MPRSAPDFHNPIFCKVFGAQRRRAVSSPPRIAPSSTAVAPSRGNHCSLETNTPIAHIGAAGVWPAASRVYGTLSNGFWLAFVISPTAQIARGVLFHPRCGPQRTAQRPRRRAFKKVSSLTSFQDLKLNRAITRALAEEKYVTPTPIQTQTIPTVISGRDVIGIAQTGTGKTAPSRFRSCIVWPRTRGRRSAGAAASSCSARPANCPRKSSTALAPTAATCG